MIALSRKAKDITGQKFNMLVALEPIDIQASNGSIIWLCRCDCGKETRARGGHLRKGTVASCGCLLIATNTKHGHNKKGQRSSTYNSWVSMNSRCADTHWHAYKDYGGRGIRVLYRDFEEFLADVGPRPPRMTIDRINVNGHYEPGNCKWSTAEAQGSNKRNNVMLTHAGKTMSLSSWAREVGIKPRLLSLRLKRGGWSVERALTEPVHEKRQ